MPDEQLQHLKPTAASYVRPVICLNSSDIPTHRAMWKHFPFTVHDTAMLNQCSCSTANNNRPDQ